MVAPRSVRRADDPESGPKILVVDDDEANLIAIRALLAELGHTVVTVRSGEEALRRLLREEFAVILLDVRMPGMDGYETAELIRGRDRTRHVPIIFLSGINKEDAHLFRGYAAGAVDYVFKPIEPVFLRSKVAVFTRLYENAQEIRRNADREKRLLAENLEIRSREARMARELEQSLMQQSLVLQSLPIALFVAPAEDGYRDRRFVGGNIERLCGLADADGDRAAKELWTDLIHPDDAERLADAIASVGATGHYELEYRVRSGDGSFRWLFERAECRPRDGTSDLLGVVTDVSMRKRLEEQLTHAQKLEAIGRMSGGIAHDVNNMLGVIVGSLDRIKATETLTPRGQQRLSLAMQAVDSCADLTKRLLGFARRQTLEPRELDIAAELERRRALFERVLGEAVAVSTDCAGDMPRVYLDPSQLESAMVNLLVNARDAMPEGGKVTVSAVPVAVPPDEAAEAGVQPGEFVRLSVADNGAGMDEETRARALEPFFTTKGPDRGTGLGLSTIYGFSRQSGGGVRIESRVGLGTTVHLYLPPVRVPRQDRKEPEGGPARDLRGTKVLLVEDNDKVREVAASMLEGLNCSVTSAANADEALKLFSCGAFDILFTDCVMPGEMDGPRLAATLQEKDPGVAVLLTSGFHEALTAVDCRRTAFVAKPYSADQLSQSLREAMDRRC